MDVVDHLEVTLSTRGAEEAGWIADCLHKLTGMTFKVIGPRPSYGVIWIVHIDIQMLLREVDMSVESYHDELCTLARGVKAGIRFMTSIEGEAVG